jgi:hypothetical protein
MLMITCTENSGTGRKLKLEGQLRQPWLEELRNSCGAGGMPPSGLSFDLAALTFIDEASVEWLDAVIRQGATITACSRFVAKMLDIGTPPSRSATDLSSISAPPVMAGHFRRPTGTKEKTPRIIRGRPASNSVR